MPGHVEIYRDQGIAVYSPAGYFAVNSLREAIPSWSRGRQRRTTVVEGVGVCLDRAKILVDELVEAAPFPI